MNHLIDHFLDAIAAEKAASHNTIEAYRHDLDDLCLFLNERKTNIENASSEDLQQYLQNIFKRSLSGKTSARRLSTIRQIYKFMCIEGFRKDNPALKLDSPKQGKALLKYLSEAEVNALMQAAHKDSSPEGLRLCAMLEIMYASGMRVTELVSLPIDIIRKKF